MSDPQQPRIVVEREVRAAPATVFGLLSDPRRHPEIDGSGTVRASVGSTRITAVGQSFVMDMDQTAVGHTELSDYQTENHVVEFVPDELITWSTARRGRDQLGLWWSYALRPNGSGGTVVTHTYDWSRVTDPATLARIQFPRIPAENLEQTLDRLAAAVETR